MHHGSGQRILERMQVCQIQHERLHLNFGILTPQKAFSLQSLLLIPLDKLALVISTNLVEGEAFQLCRVKAVELSGLEEDAEG